MTKHSEFKQQHGPKWGCVGSRYIVGSTRFTCRRRRRVSGALALWAQWCGRAASDPGIFRPGESSHFGFMCHHDPDNTEHRWCEHTHLTHPLGFHGNHHGNHTDIFSFKQVVWAKVNEAYRPWSSKINIFLFKDYLLVERERMQQRSEGWKMFKSCSWWKALTWVVYRC